MRGEKKTEKATLERKSDIARNIGVKKCRKKETV